MNMMKVLVNHSSGNNLGDMAMIEGVVRRLLHTAKGVNLCVLDNFSLPKEMWEWNNVTRVTMRLSDPLPRVAYVNRIPYIRRYERQLKTIGIHSSLAMLDLGINANDIRVSDGSDSTTLENWCSAYDAMHFVGMGGFTDIFLKDVWHYCYMIYTLASQGKPVIFTGQQIGPFHSWLTKNLVQSSLRKAEFIGLREPTDSLVFCEQADLDSNRFAVMGDDSFGVPAADSEHVKSFLSRFGLSPGKFIAVNVRVGNYASSHAEYIQCIADLMSNLSQRYDLPVVVVPIALDIWDSDIDSGYRLCEAVGGDRIQVLDKPEELTAALVKGILGQAYAAVGVSYHFCTFALSQGVPAICIFDGDYYSQKARGLSRFWEDERLALPLKKLDLKEATRQVYELIEDQEFREALRIRAEIAIKRWEEIFDLKVNEMLLRCNNSTTSV